MNNTEIKEEILKASRIIENVDEIVTNNLVKSKYGSEDFKQNQRISNGLLNIIRAIDSLKYEL